MREYLNNTGMLRVRQKSTVVYYSPVIFGHIFGQKQDFGSIRFLLKVKTFPTKKN